MLRLYWMKDCMHKCTYKGLRKSDIFWGKFSYIGAMLHIMGCLWIPDPSQISLRKKLPDPNSITTILFVSMNERSRFIMFISFLQIPIMVTDLGSTERDKFWEIQNPIWQILKGDCNPQIRALKFYVRDNAMCDMLYKIPEKYFKWSQTNLVQWTQRIQNIVWGLVRFYITQENHLVGKRMNPLRKKDCV